MKATLATALLMVLTATSAVAADLHDPMRPANAPAAAPLRQRGAAPLQLQAIMSTTGSRLAIVDGKVVRIGDKVSGALIDGISSDSIRYTRGGKALVASLPNTNKLNVRTNSALQAGQP